MAPEMKPSPHDAFVNGQASRLLEGFQRRAEVFVSRSSLGPSGGDWREFALAWSIAREVTIRHGNRQLAGGGITEFVPAERGRFAESINDSVRTMGGAPHGCNVILSSG